MKAVESVVTHQMSENPAVHYDQNYFQLGSIQGAAIGIPGIVFGGALAGQYGAGTALSSILIGNLILWTIGLIIISMSLHRGINAVQNISGYLGKTGSVLAILVLALIFLNWFALEINYTMTLLGRALSPDTSPQHNILKYIGIGFGVIISLLAIGGIRLLRRISVVSAPLLVLLGIYAISQSETHFAVFDATPSFLAIVTTILIFIPGMINLPTFFRHSRSTADSHLGLTYMILYYTFFECMGIWVDMSHYLGPMIFSLVLLILLLCNNLMNIYFASACYEALMPRFSRTKSYMITGLIGTLVYTYVPISAPLKFGVDLLNAYLVSLGIVLVIAFIVRIVVQHRPRPTEKAINTISWLIGCCVATILKFQNPQDKIHFLLFGVGATGLFFLAVLYIEETYWSSKKIIVKQDKLDK